MSNRQMLRSATAALLVVALIAFACGAFALKIRQHVLLIWSLLMGFCIAIVITHVVAWFGRGKITKQHLRIIDYVCLSIAAIGLCAISTIDARIADWQARESGSYLNATLDRAKSKADWTEDYYKQWSPDQDFDGYPAEDVANWGRKTRALLAEPYEEGRWDNHIKNSREKYRRNPPDEIDYILSQMVIYQQTHAEQQSRLAIAENDSYFYIQYFGFWALALALALQIVKVSIEAMGWIAN